MSISLNLSIRLKSRWKEMKYIFLPQTLVLSMKEKLRVGLLVEEFNIPAWAYRMLERIKEEGFAEITLIIKKETQKPAETKLNKFRKAFPFLLYLQYKKIDK